MRRLQKQGVFVSLRLAGLSWCFPVENLSEGAAYVRCGPELLPEFPTRAECEATVHFPETDRRDPIHVEARIVRSDTGGFVLGWEGAAVVR